MLNTSNDQRKLLSNFEHLFATTAQAPGGVARLRELILTLAVQGKLVAQDARDEPASELLKKIRAEKDRLIAEGKIKKDKPLAEITDEEKPFKLPEGWEWVRSIDFCALITDGDHQAPPKSESGVPFLVIGDIREGFVNLEGASRFVPLEYFTNLDPGKKPLAGDILYTTVGSFGIPVPVKKQEDFCFQRHIALFRLIFKSMQNYVELILKSRFVFDQASEAATGTAQKTVPLSALRSLLFPLPPLAEQSRIVVRVEELMRLCDALEEKGRLEHTQHQQLLQAMLDSLTQTTDAHELARHWQRLAQHFDLLIDRPEAVDALEQTILQLAVRGLLVPQDPSDEPASELLKKIRAEKDRLIAEGKIKKDKPLPVIGEDEKPFDLTEGWEWVRVGQVASRVQYGVTASADHTQAEPKFVRITDIQNDQVNWDTVPGMLGVNQELAAHYLNSGDLLVARTGGTIGKSFLVLSVPLKAVFASYLIRVSPFSGINPSYLKIFASSAHYWEQLYAKSMGTGQPNVNGTALSELALPLPPFAEQSRIVARVTELRALCQQLREKLTQARTTQTQLAQAWVEQVAA